MIPRPQPSTDSASGTRASAGRCKPDSPAPWEGTGRTLPLASPPSSRALAMLTLLPIHAAAVSRVHVDKRQPDGTIRVFDRPTGQHLLVYSPRFTQQFRAGHRAGRWYVRPLIYVGVRPQSHAFATARGAIEAVSAGTWDLKAPVRNCRTPWPHRVIWPDREGASDSTAPLGPRHRDTASSIHPSSERAS
jgi:hypothetical protein